MAWWTVDRSHHLSNLLFAIQPPAKFLSSVRMHNPDLVFITVVVRHVLPPKRQDGSRWSWGAGAEEQLKRDAPAPPYMTRTIKR